MVIFFINLKHSFFDGTFMGQALLIFNNYKILLKLYTLLL